MRAAAGHRGQPGHGQPSDGHYSQEQAADRTRRRRPVTVVENDTGAGPSTAGGVVG